MALKRFEKGSEYVIIASEPFSGRFLLQFPEIWGVKYEKGKFIGQNREETTWERSLQSQIRRAEWAKPPPPSIWRPVWRRRGAKYGLSKRGSQMSSYQLLIGEGKPEDAVQSTQFGVDVIPANSQLAGAGIELVPLPRRENRLREGLAPLAGHYDYIFIDCPPSLDLLTLNGLCASDTVLVPIQCEYYALEGLSELMATLKTVRKKYNSYLDVEGVAFTMYSGRLNLTLQVVEQVKKFFGDKVYKTTVPRNVRLSEAPSYGQPINFYDPSSKGCEAYMDMAKEFLRNNERK